MLIGMKINFTILILVTILILIAILIDVLIITKHVPQPVSQLSSNVNLNFIEAETFRLQSLTEGINGHNLTLEEVSKLGELTANDKKFYSEYLEVVWLIKHNYPKHVSHSLNSIYWLAKERRGDGKWLCPADQLSHVGIYLQFNEIKRAQDAVADGKETLNEWVANARKTKSRNESYYPNLELIIDSMNRLIRQMDNGDYLSAKNESLYLGEIGYC